MRVFGKRTALLLDRIVDSLQLMARRKVLPAMARRRVFPAVTITKKRVFLRRKLGVVSESMLAASPTNRRKKKKQRRPN